MWRTSRKYTTSVFIRGSLIEAYLFESIEGDEECNYDHTLIDDSSEQNGDKENCSVGEDNSNMYKET